MSSLLFGLLLFHLAFTGDLAFLASGNDRDACQDEQHTNAQLWRDYLCEEQPAKQYRSQVIHAKVLHSCLRCAIFLHGEHVEAKHEDVGTDHEHDEHDVQAVLDDLAATRESSLGQKHVMNCACGCIEVKSALGWKIK